MEISVANQRRDPLFFFRIPHSQHNAFFWCNAKSKPEKEKKNIAGACRNKPNIVGVFFFLLGAKQ